MSAVLASARNENSTVSRGMPRPQLRLVAAHTLSQTRASELTKVVCDTPSRVERLAELRTLAPTHPALRDYSRSATVAARRAQRSAVPRLLLQGSLYLLVALVVVFLGIMVGYLISPGAWAAPVDYLIHTIRPGDTLWTVAAAHPGALSTSEMVARLMELNSLEATSTLSAGQQILVPLF